MAPLFSFDLAPPGGGRSGWCSTLIWPRPRGIGRRVAAAVTGRMGRPGGSWIASRVSLSFVRGRDGAEESGVVRGDPLRLAAQPDVGAGAVSQVRRAPPDGAPGDRVAGPAGP